MKIDQFAKAALASFSITLAATQPGAAETLTIMQGATSSALSVSMSRAVVVEADQPFAEVSIANPGIADISTLSDRSLYVLGKSPGRTTLTLLSPEGQLITNVEIHVTPDIAEFKERLQQILPGEKIEVRTANDGIVLSGTVSSIQRLERAMILANRYAPGRVSNLMMVGGTQQVMLKVRFAEMQRSVSKELSGGLTMNILNGGTGGALGGGSGGLGASGGSVGGIGAGVTTDPTKTGGLFLGTTVGSLELGVMLEALESRGVVRTLAEPNLTALSGQEANFLAGGEYPIPVVDGDGNVAIDYKPFGVELNFTPRVVDGDQINLELSAAVSGIDPTVTVQNAGFSVNGFSRRESTTTVEMRDGESFAIAGLLQDDFRDLSGQVHWLGDIPILGALFRSAEFERQQTELVIIITPHLVSATRGEALALPTDRIRPPTEAELFLFGRTAVRSRPTSGAAGEVAKQDFSGSYGYVLE